MVALKDKSKWTRTEYKGEQESSSRDMNYNSFDYASVDLRYHSSPSTLSLSIVASGIFLYRLPDCHPAQETHQSCQKTLYDLKYSMSIESLLPLNKLCKCIRAVSLVCNIEAWGSSVRGDEAVLTALWQHHYSLAIRCYDYHHHRYVLL